MLTEQVRPQRERMHVGLAESLDGLLRRLGERVAGPIERGVDKCRRTGPLVPYGQQRVQERRLQGLPECPHRRPTAITEQICWWDGTCPVSASGPACMADIAAGDVASAVLNLLRRHSFADDHTQQPRPRQG